MTSNQHALQVTPALGESISCTIPGDETIRRTNDDGTPSIEVLIDDDEHTRTEQPTSHKTPSPENLWLPQRNRATRNSLRFNDGRKKAARLHRTLHPSPNDETKLVILQP